MVEEILKESRLEIYDDPDQQQQNQPDGDEAADDRIVEQFRRDFMDAVQTRNNRRPPASSSSAAKGKQDDRPKGPKLGGSRSARAAMRALEEKQAGAKKR
ncbi:hypothetical protein UCRNP2_4710 [Neofusicoccum parvum UCRNP2]|uniref:Uncharacterized protein n=1 Tax=Botryosphaeria parva (strain UCR-NP2) TaxID=1287680 RepID=R1GAH2_BOTPV|nr:hypothetical protein UCRNP2_4710 [Neofusicoccum parvum UCRNP2]